jgi:hypothetical protein
MLAAAVTGIGNDDNIVTIEESSVATRRHIHISEQ